MKNRNMEKIPAILGLMLFFVQGDSAAAAPLIVALANDFSITVSEAGFTAAAYLIPFGLFTVIFGPLGDKWGRGPLIKTAAFGTALFSILGAVAPNYYILLIFRVFNGIFAAALMPVSMALIGELAGSDNKILHKKLGKTLSFMFLGGSVAPLIGGTLSYIGSWRLVYLAYGVFEFIFAIVILISLKGFSNSNKSVTFLSSYRDAVRNSGLMKTVPVIGLLGLIFLGSFSYMGKFIDSKFNITLLQIGLMLSLYGLGTMIGGRLGPGLEIKLGKKYFIFASIIGISSLVIFYFTSLLWLIGLALVMFGISFTLLQPRLLAFAQSQLPGRRGTVMSIVSLNMSLGGGLGTLLYGLILNQFDFKIIYLIGALLFLVLAVWITLIFANLKREVPV